MRAESFESLIRYEALISDNVVLMKDGCLLSGFRYIGADLDAVPAEEKQSVAAVANNALKHLGGGYMLHFETVRVRTTAYPKGEFSELVTKIIDTERELQFKNFGSHYETENYIFLTWEPPVMKKSTLLRKAAAFFTGTGAERDFAVDAWLESFENDFGDFMNSLSAIFRIEPLHGEKLLSMLNLCVTGRRSMCMPETPWNLSALFARDMTVGDPLILDDEYVAVLSIDGFPQQSEPSVLDVLGRMRCEYRWSTRFIPMDFRAAHSYISKIHSKWALKTIPLLAQISGKPTTKIDKDAQRQSDDANDALQLLNEGLVSFGHYTGVVILRAASEKELDETAAALKRAIEEIFFSVRIERRNAVEAFIGSLPGHGYENVRKHLVHSLNICHFVSLSSMWAGLKYNPCRFYPERSPALMQAVAYGDNPFRLHLHVGDVGHTLILGPTGAGKSTLLAAIAAQFDRYPGSQIFVFDKGRSMFPLISAMNGSVFYNLGGDDSPPLCPLASLSAQSDVTWAMEFVETLVALNGGEMTPERRRIVAGALRVMQSATRDASERSLTALHIDIQDEHVKDALEIYTHGGVYGQYLDGTESGITYSKVTAFEIGELMQRGEKVYTPALLHLFHEIERRADGRPTLIIVDEAWVALSTPLFAEKLREWLKVLRKANAAVILATQSLEDIARSEIASSVFDSCPTKILLPNPAAKSDAMRDIYVRQLHLNSAEISAVANSTPKRDYFYISPNGRRMFRLDLGDVALAFLASSGPDELKRIDELIAGHGKEWPPYWLEEKGSEDWAGYWRKLARESRI